MCGCDKPTMNGQPGYKWQLTDQPHVYPLMPPDLQEADELLYDEPGRCRPNVGGIVKIDFHSHHFRLVKNHGRFYLLVAHGGGEERIALGWDHTRFAELLEPMDSDRRYLMLHNLHHIHHVATQMARDTERAIWQQAAAEKRIKTRKLPAQGYIKVWIEPKQLPAGVLAE